MAKRRCVLRGVQGKCEGPIERHHLIKRQAIKAWIKYLWSLPRHVRWKRKLPDPTMLPSFTRAIADPRIQADTCNRHHQLVTNHRIKSEDIPDEAREFADELGMGWYWYYEERKVTAE